MADALDLLRARPIAHRGLHACGRPGAVENSISAADAAIAAGYGIECDVQLSADGEAMVFHDATLDRLTGIPRETRATDARTLSGLLLKDGPDQIPTLGEFLAAIDGRTALVVEVKVQPAGDMRLADRTLALMRAYAGPIALESFDPVVIAHCRAQRPPCPLGLVGPPEDGSQTVDSDLGLCDFVSWNIDRIAEITRRRPGLPRTTWTVRTLVQERLARSCDAQIVFEDFVPTTLR